MGDGDVTGPKLHVRRCLGHRYVVFFLSVSYILTNSFFIIFRFALCFEWMVTAGLDGGD